MQEKTIKFFISSTFKDFLKERNALQNIVFPKLQKLCESKAFSFQPIDLRWGVTEESSEDNRTMNYCLNEVARCSFDPKPNLLILLGQRYGWGPLPTSITEEEYNVIVDFNSNPKSIKGLYLRYYPHAVQLLNKWYTQDLNDLDKKYFLKDKQRLDRKTWEAIEKELKVIIQTATIDKKLDPEYSRFHTSATEQEIKDAIEKQYKVDCNNTIVYNREFNTDKDSDFIQNDNDSPEKLTLLKEYLTSKKLTSIDNSGININNYKLTKDDCKEYGLLSDDLKYFCVRVLREFGRNIQKEIKKHNQKHNTPLKIELSEQKKFLESKYKILEDVVGRDDEVEEIIDFIINKSNKFYLLHGKSGSGKTSVMAKTIQDEKLKDKDIIYRFIGTTGHTTSPRDTYEYIYWQLINKDGNKPTNIEHDDQKFYQQFIDALKNYSQEKPLVLFIDAVDQFNSFDSLEIFLEYTPDNVKVVFSCLYDDDELKKDNKDYTEYYKRLSDIDYKKELKLLHEDNNKIILENWLKKKNRTLQQSEENNQWEILLNASKDKSPLYLKLAFEIAKEWKSKSTITEDVLGKKEEDLILKFFENVSRKHYVKKELLGLSLGLISASKDGLSEKELVDILSNEKDILALYERERSSYPKLSKLPDAIFSKMYYHIQDIFTERFIDDERLINPYHRIVEEVIKVEYHDKLANLHTKLQEYFREKSFDIMIQSDNIKLKLKNFMYHLYHLQEYEKLEILLIIFDKKIVKNLYSENFVDLIALYSFDSKVPEVKKLQGMKLILDECFIKNDENLYEKKDYQLIDLDHEKLIEYGIKDFGSIFKNMISQIGIQQFILEESQESNIDEIVWLKNYTWEDNYANLHIGLIGTDYKNFNLKELIKNNNICNECNCLRRDEQLIDETCKKCLIDKKRYSEIKDWLEEAGYYIWEDEYIDIYRSEFEEWKSGQESLSDDEFNSLNEEMREKDQPEFTNSIYKEANWATNYNKEEDYDIQDYIGMSLKLSLFNPDEDLEKYGFTYE